jgi:hypothetical protein
VVPGRAQVSMAGRSATEPLATNAVPSMVPETVAGEALSLLEPQSRLSAKPTAGKPNLMARLLQPPRIT